MIVMLCANKIESIFILNFDIGAGENGINEPGIGPSIVRIQLGVEGKELP